MYATPRRTADGVPAVLALVGDGAHQLDDSLDRVGFRLREQDAQLVRGARPFRRLAQGSLQLCRPPGTVIDCRDRP